MKRSAYLFNYFFVIGLVVLVLNDHIFKASFGNWFTGKLSDIAGIFVLPFFLSYFFKEYLKLNVIASGLFFVFWKLPVSQGFIEFYNQFAIIKILRVVDYSDLIVLSVLPISYWCLKHINRFGFKLFQHKRIPEVILIPLVCFIFMATSPPESYYFTQSSGNIKMNWSMKVKLSEKEVISKLNSEDIKARLDSVYLVAIENVSPTKFSEEKRNYHYYIIDTLKIESEVLYGVQFGLHPLDEMKTKLYLNAVNVENPPTDADIFEDLQATYQRKIKLRLKDILK